MKHIHFVIYRLKSINIIIYYCFSFYLLTHIFIICIYSEIEFIKPLDDVKIQDEGNCTVFINKMINSGITRMFICFYNIYTYIFYFVSQVLCVCTNDRDLFSMRNIVFLFVMILFFFYLIIWWGIGIASDSKLDVLKDGCFYHHKCFYYFLLFCLIILFYYYSNIPYIGK
jgi:hypothetical protein